MKRFLSSYVYISTWLLLSIPTLISAQPLCLATRGDYVQVMELDLGTSALRDAVEGFKECLTGARPTEGATDRLLLAQAGVRLAIETRREDVFLEAWGYIRALDALEKSHPTIRAERLFLEGKWYHAVPEAAIKNAMGALEPLKDKKAENARDYGLTLDKEAENAFAGSDRHHEVRFFRLKEAFSLSKPESRNLPLDEMKSFRNELTKLAELKRMTPYAAEAAINLLLFLGPRLTVDERTTMCGDDLFSPCTKLALAELETYKHLLLQLPGSFRELEALAKQYYAYDSTLGLKVVDVVSDREKSASAQGLQQLVFMKGKVEALRREREATVDEETRDNLTLEVLRWATWTTNAVLYPPIKTQDLRNEWQKKIPTKDMIVWLKEESSSSENTEIKRVALLGELYRQDGQADEARKQIQALLDAYGDPESPDYFSRIQRPSTRVDPVNIILLQAVRLNLEDRTTAQSKARGKALKNSIERYHHEFFSGSSQPPAWLEELYAKTQDG